MNREVLKSIGVWLLAGFSAYITFLATCHSVTRIAVEVAKPGPADHAGITIGYGLFLGFPLGAVVALFVANKVQKFFRKPKDEE